MITRENEKGQRDLAMLRYQAKNYQTIGYGAKSQALNVKIRRLLDELNVDAAKN